MQWYGLEGSRWGRWGAVLALLIGLLAASSAAAQVLSIEINKGRTVKLDRPAASVFIANPDIADIQLITPTMLYVFGRATGETSLLAVDARDRIMVDRRGCLTCGAWAFSGRASVLSIASGVEAWIAARSAEATGVEAIGASSS